MRHILEYMISLPLFIKTPKCIVLFLLFVAEVLEMTSVLNYINEKINQLGVQYSAYIVVAIWFSVIIFRLYGRMYGIPSIPRRL